MKRLFSFVLALALVLSLGITASANNTNTGSIEITNATINDTYKVYKIFDAAYVVDAQGNTAVSYTISKKIDEAENVIFTYLFDDGTQENDFFTYEPDDENGGKVYRKEGPTDAQIFEYLTDMIRDGKHNGLAAEQEAASQNLKFTGLSYGYYLIDKNASNDVAVTIDSNTPDVKVIDKNQTPNSGDSFKKKIVEGTNKVESSTANIGEVIDWEISFNATNYHDEYAVQYYTVRDNKSSSLWIEFNSIQVTVGTKKLTKGYYYCANNAIATGEWGLLGDGWAADAVYADVANQAEWYLIHYGYDEIEIVIPWLDDYTFEGVQDPVKGYNLTFDLSTIDGNTVLSEPMYPATTTVVVEYKAAVGPGAANTESTNSAHLDWVTALGTFGPEDPETTKTKVYNMGINKIANDGDSTTSGSPLAGAIFQVWRECTENDDGTYTYSNPVYVIPTNNEGVYILDDVDNTVSGTNRTSSREMYYSTDALKAELVEWLKKDPNPDKPENSTDYNLNKRNDVVSPASGQIVILGLDAGDYYLEEVQAPVGYNRLTGPVTATVGSGVAATYNNGYENLKGEAITYSVYSTTIQNSRGMELPSTGGQGTMMLITFGSLIAMAFAVLLITHKKMSVYHD